MKVLAVLVVCLVLGVSARRRRTTPPGDSSEAVLSAKHSARVVSSYGLSSDLVEKLRKGLEKVYNRKDTDQQLANKYLTKTYEILDYPVNVFVKTVDGYSRSMVSFSVELRIHDRDVYVYG